MRRNITNYEDESVNKGYISITRKVVYLEIRDLHVQNNVINSVSVNIIPNNGFLLNYEYILQLLMLFAI